MNFFKIIDGVGIMYERIQKLCEQSGITVKELENECGIKNSTICKWKESMPKADNLYKVACYFNVSMAYLLTGEEESPSPAGDGLNKEIFSTAWNEATPEAREAALSVLRLSKRVL